MLELEQNTLGMRNSLPLLLGLCMLLVMLAFLAARRLLPWRGKPLPLPWLKGSSGRAAAAAARVHAAAAARLLFKGSRAVSAAFQSRAAAKGSTH